LIETIWDGRTVSESALTSRINQPRARRSATAAGPGSDPHHRAQGLSLRWRRSPCRTGHRRAVKRKKFAVAAARYRPAIAVLPFTNMSGEPEQSIFSDGISEDIITALSKLRWFLRDRAQLLVHLQGQVGALKAGRDELGVWLRRRR